MKRPDNIIELYLTEGSDMKRRGSFFLLCVLYLFCIMFSNAAASVYAAEKGQDKDSGVPSVLDTKSFWRMRMTVGTDRVRLKSGELVYYGGKKTIKKHKEWEVIKAENPRCWGGPPEDWNSPDFNDSSWSVLQGPFGLSRFIPVSNIYLRGKFRVADPSNGKKLRLSITYQGGIVAYLNGREFARAGLPEGEIKPETPAEGYPLEAFTDEKGYLLKRRKRKDTKSAEHDRYKLRNRHITVDVPSNLLKKGVNVLALDIHRAPAAEVFYIGKVMARRPLFKEGHLKKHAWWSRCGLVSLNFTGEKTEGIIPNAGHTGRPQGFQVWTQPSFASVSSLSYSSPEEGLLPLPLCGAKNGVYSGQIIAGSGKAIQGLKAEASELKGPGTIEASCIRIRYALPLRGRSRSVFIGGRHSSCGLEEFPPGTVQVSGDGAVQPIWVTVHIPKDAKPGDYTGTVTVTADGNEPREVPVHLHVIDWTMPDPPDFTGFLGLIQSPESVAMYYKVPMWSDKHWELLEKTFSVLREVGTKTLYITAQRKTHFGNEHAMIRFIKEADGTYTPDLSIAEKYVDIAISRLGRIPVVGLYLWRAPWVTGNYAGAGPRGDRKILLTLKDPKTGQLSEEEGPAWGTPEVVKLWRPVVDGVKKILNKHGMEKSLMIGLAGDYHPTDTALADLDRASGGLEWVLHSHVVRNRLGNMGSTPIGSRKWTKGKGKTYPCRYIAAGWGGHAHHRDPFSGDRGYGWKNPVLRVETRSYPGGILGPRFKIEYNMTSIAKKSPKGAGLYGYGRIGADFWPVLGSGGRKKYLAGRYPETAWGQLSLRCCGTQVIAPGKEGALGSTAIEMYRENLQEIEARIFIEKILTDPAGKEKLGSELAQKAQETLDQRTRMINNHGYGMIILPLIAEYSESLYRLTEEVAKAVE